MIDSFEKKQLLRRAIIQTVAFFDLFDYPLTAYEIWENLSGDFNFLQIFEVLPRMNADIAYQNGFYFLPGRHQLINCRRARYNFTYRKIKIARRFSTLFSLCPFVYTVAVANALGRHNLRDGSDIDFFIIVQSGRLWLSRLYCTGLAKLLNSRPTPKCKKDKICLSFYLADNYLNLDQLRLKGGDPYFDYWRKNLILLYNKNRTYEQFLIANNLKNCVVFPVVSVIKNQIALRANLGENLAKAFQLTILPVALKRAMDNSDGVLINDQVLKLYQRDNRRQYAEKYEKKLYEIFAENN